MLVYLLLEESALLATRRIRIVTRPHEIYSASTKCYRVSRKVWKYRQPLSIAIVRRKGGTHARWRGIGHHESPLSRLPRAPVPVSHRSFSLFLLLTEDRRSIFRNTSCDEIRRVRDNGWDTADFFRWTVRFYTWRFLSLPYPFGWPMSLVETSLACPHLYPISKLQTSLLESTWLQLETVNPVNRDKNVFSIIVVTYGAPAILGRGVVGIHVISPA